MSLYAAMLGESGGPLGRLLGPAGYELVRDTPVAAVLPWRVLEFQHV